MSEAIRAIAMTSLGEINLQRSAVGKVYVLLCSHNLWGVLTADVAAIRANHQLHTQANHDISLCRNTKSSLLRRDFHIDPQRRQSHPVNIAAIFIAAPARPQPPATSNPSTLSHSRKSQNLPG